MIITAIVFIVVLSILIFVHELGHFLVARAIGVKVEEFGFGLPPRIIGKKVGDTIYSLNWLPIGGFVRLLGEDEEERSADKSSLGKAKLREYFWARSKKERSAVLVAGVTMNFILAVGITAFLLVDGVKEPSGRVHIEKVTKASPAEVSGLLAGDVVQTIEFSGGSKIFHTPMDLIDTVKAHAGETVILTIARDGSALRIPLTPRTNPPEGEGPMGVAVTDLETKKYPLSQAPFVAVKINIDRAYLMLAGILQTIWKLISFQSVGGEVAGPIGIAQVTGEAVKFGFRAVLEFMSILSLNLAVLNILPIPALDGGRLAFVFVEKILGKKVRPAFEKNAHQIGMILLLLLILLVSINDIMRLARGG